MDEKVVNIVAWAWHYKNFTSVFTNVRNKLECLSLGSLSSLVQRLEVWLDPA